jgi:hypothetical protein
MANALEDALSRLATFRARWEFAGVIDEHGGLTAANLDVIIVLTPALKPDVEGMTLNDN